MTCKDCLGYNFCSRGRDGLTNFYGAENACGNVEYLCSDFQNKADFVEVKHGEWVSLTECSNAGVYCSLCHKKVYKEDYAWCNRKNKLRSDYCPNCGAKMDGGK